VISTHPPERSNWLEAGVVERARAELDIPVTHVIVDLTRSGAAA
jgi:GABA permease